MMACRDGGYEVTNALLEGGADPTAPGGVYRRGALGLMEQYQSLGECLLQKEGETHGQAMAREEKVYSLLAEYAAQHEG